MVDVWRSIETAPKDGTVFLAVWLGKVRTASWNVEQQNWQEYPDGDFDCGDELTHWMPMPEPPEAVVSQAAAGYTTFAETFKDGDEVRTSLGTMIYRAPGSLERKS